MLNYHLTPDIIESDMPKGAVANDGPRLVGCPVMPKIAEALRLFVPEQWGQVDRFITFYHETYSFNDRDKRAVGGVRNHFQKSITLIRLAEKLRPNLQIDRDQLENLGFSPELNGEEISTVIEAAILELYSTVDCTVKVLRAIYGKSRGFKDSTRKFFQSINDIGDDFPEPLRQVVLAADWYWRLMKLRDELVHLGTGVVRQDRDTQVASYSHYGLTENDKLFLIEDIYGWLHTTAAQINGFIGSIFHYLNRKLIDREIFLPCGMVQGRMLWRYLSPVGEINFNSGRCGAWVWFEEPGEPLCPFVPMCGAYQRKASALTDDP